MNIPPKPKRGKRSPFYWWRRWKSHKYLPTKKGLLARILNGDFEYPDQFEWAKYELHYMQDELDKFVNEYQGNDPKEDSRYYDIHRDGKLEYAIAQSQVEICNKIGGYLEEILEMDSDQIKDELK